MEKTAVLIWGLVILLIYSPAIFATETIGTGAAISHVLSVCLCILAIYFVRKLPSEVARQEVASLHHWKQFAWTLLEMLFLATIVVLILVIGLSANLYALAQRTSGFVPFGSELTRLGAIAFVADQALKGMFLDFMEVFQISLTHKANYQSRDFLIFSTFLFLFRTLVAGVTIQVVIEMFRARDRNRARFRKITVGGNAQLYDLKALQDTLMTNEKIIEYMRSCFPNDAGLQGEIEPDERTPSGVTVLSADPELNVSWR
jgi:hypothetical protein